MTFKCKLLAELGKLVHARVLFPQTVLRVAHPGISAKNISEWNTDKDRLFLLRAEGYGRFRHVVAERKAAFPECEDRVYIQFCYRRMVQGFDVDDEWLVRRMREALKDMQPPGWQNSKGSNGWLEKFKRRYRITWQLRTNKTVLPIWARLSTFKAFHQYFLHVVQKSGVPRCLKYGRFPANHIHYMDQVPVAFINNANRSLNSIGQPCFIKMPHGSGLDKRMATIQLTLGAGPFQRVRPAVILRGRGWQLRPEERRVYASLRHLVQVYFQPYAWSDEQVSLLWLDQFHAETKHLPFQVCLGMDRHGAQMTLAFRRKLREYGQCFCRRFTCRDICVSDALNFCFLGHPCVSLRGVCAGILAVYIPARTTDVLAPVDHHAGARLKRDVSQLYKAELEENDQAWTNPPSHGGLQDWQKRVKLVLWIATAWQIMRQDPAFIKSTFVSCGWLIAQDGSENHLIKVPGCPEYDFTLP